MSICKLTIFFLINLLQQGTRTCFCLVVCHCREICPESFVLIKHFRPIWNSCIASIAKMFEYLSNATTGKDKNAFISTSWKWKRRKDRLHKKLFWEYVASGFLCSSQHIFLYLSPHQVHLENLSKKRTEGNVECEGSNIAIKWFGFR